MRIQVVGIVIPHQEGHALRVSLFELNDVLEVFEQKLVGNVGIRIKVVSQKDNMADGKFPTISFQAVRP